MLVTYEFIDFRQNLQSEVNVALAVWHEVMTKLGRYTKAKFERKQWWPFMRKRKFVRIEVPLQYQDLMPRREDHENLLGPLEK